MFSRLGPWCHDHRWKVVIGWVLLLFVANGIASGVGEAYRQDFSLKGFESTDGFTLVESEFDDGSGSPQFGQIVFQAEQGVTDPEVQAAMEGLFTDVAEIDDVTAVQSPYATGGEFQISTQGEAPGTIAYAVVNLPEDIDFTRASDIAEEIRDELPEIEGVRFELGGFLFAEFEQPSAELFGLAFAVIILIVAFGSVLAMGLPVGVALFGIGLGGALVILVSNLMEVPDFAPFIGLMIGLGVGHRLRAAHRHPLPGTAPRRPRRPRVDRHRDGHGGPVGGVRRRDGRDLAVRDAPHGHRVHQRAGRHRQSLTVAAHGAGVDHVAPCAPRLRGPQHRAHQVARPHRRGLHGRWARGGRAQDRAARRHGLRPRGRHDRPRVLREAACSARCEHRPPKPRRETAAYRWSRIIQRRPWPFAIGAAAFLLRAGASRSSTCASASPTRATSPMTPPPSRPTTSSSRASVRASTAPVYLVAEVDGAEQAGALAGGERGGRGRPRRRLGARPAAERPRGPDRRAVARHPHRRGRRTRRRPHLVDRLRDDVLPPDRGGGRRRRARHRAGRRATSTCRSTWPSGCRSSSAPCSRCRSCC